MNRLNRTLALVILLIAVPAAAHPPEEFLEGDELTWLLKKKLKLAHKNEASYQARIAELEKNLQVTEETGSSAKQTLEQRAASLEHENQLLKQRLSALGQEAGKTTANMEELKRRMEELKKAQEAAEKRAAQFRDMVAKFKSMVDAGKLQVEIRNGLMLVKLPDNILFDPGKTDLKSAGKEALRQVTEILNGIEGRKFQVTGHTDNVPIRGKRFKSNWELSAARAVEVVKVMMAAGMDGARLSAAGYADQLPVAPNADALGRLQNRRIEIVVQPNLEDLPQIDQKIDAARP